MAFKASKIDHQLIARRIDQVYKGQQGVFRQNSRLKNDVYVILYYDKKRQKITQTIQGANALKELIIRKNEKGFDYIKIPAGQQITDVHRAEYEMRKR